MDCYSLMWPQENTIQEEQVPLRMRLGQRGQLLKVGQYKEFILLVQ